MSEEQYEMHRRLQTFYKKALGKERGNDFRVPLPINPNHPKRGLWCMLNGVKVLEENKTYCVLWIDEQSYEASDPTTAMLIALCKQEGV